jgi:homoserine kinase
VALEARVQLAVPPARGLGSSATAIVAGLMGANALVGEPLSQEKLLELAIDIEGHPDNVVPSLVGGLCMTARAASHRWRVVRCEWAPSVKAVVAIPAIRLSTSEARRAMPRSIPIPDAVLNLGALTLLLQGLRSGNGDLIADGLHDRIHEPYRWGLIQGGRAVREAALEAGAWGCVISGAGPTLLALAGPSVAQAVSDAMVKAWEAEGVPSSGAVLDIQMNGSRWEPLPSRTQ